MSAWAIVKSEEPLLGWKRGCIKTYTGVPCKVYNSVPVVLYLKPFRTTGCKIVAIQTEARPAVQSTQPAYALHVICAIHTVSHFHGAALEAISMARNVCRDLVFEVSSHVACSHSDLGSCADCTAEALPARQTASIRCWHAQVQLSDDDDF